jgi:hypothetical protein
MEFWLVEAVEKVVMISQYGGKVLFSLTTLTLP